jgi:hypothetical protein
MLWLIAGLPAASVVAGIGLVAAAIVSGGADVVNDEVQRTAQIQVTELGPDERAHSLRLSALLRIDGDMLEVFPVSGEFARDRPLTLTLEHPSATAQDRTVSLRPSAQGWRIAFDAARSHDWLLRLEPEHSSEWRLRGRLGADRHACYLGPALAGD